MHVKYIFFLISGEKARPARLLRSQQAFGSGAVEDEDNAEAGDNADNDDEDQDEEADPYDLLDPVDILDKLPKNFYELVEEKKWQLRKEALDALLPLSQSPKISPSGDYNDLIRVLKKFIAKDTNVMLVTLAAQCLTGVAKGLRTAFKNGASQLLPVVMEKFKEKKVTVVAALVEAADALYPSLGIEAVQEDVLASLKHKTPGVVTETSKFIGRCFAKCPPQLATNKKMVKGYVSALLDSLNHADGNVREASSEALGVLMKILGEPAMNKLMPDLDAIKMAKVKEHCDKAVLTGKMPKIQSTSQAEEAKSKAIKTKGAVQAARKTSKPASSGARPGAKTSVAKKPVQPPKDDSDNYDDEFEAAAPPPARKPSSAPARRGGLAGRGRGSRPATAASAASRKKSEDVDMGPPYSNNNLKSQRFRDEQKLKVLKWHFSQPRAEFVDQLKDQMTVANFNR